MRCIPVRQRPQSAIYRKEYELGQSDLAQISLENSNLHKCYGDAGAWVQEKQMNIEALEAALNKKDSEIKLLGLSVTESEKKLSNFEREYQEKSSCKVCMEDDISVFVAFLPCSHLCCCSSCANKPALTNCPIGRVSITEKLRVFHS